MRHKIREYGRAASPLAAYALLGVIWFAVFNQFVHAMEPRLHHVGASGAKLVDAPCDNPQCDFSAFWPAGLLARTGRVTEIYRQAPFQAFRHTLLAPGTPAVRWFYPPPALLPAAAVSFLPFETAFWLWSLALTAVAILLLRRAGLGWLVIAVSLLSPAALWNLELGQLGIIMAGIVCSGLLSAGGRPLRAGFILSFLVLKPQSGLLAVVALAATGWRALAAFAAGIAGIFAISTLFFGWRVWIEYATHGIALSGAFLNATHQASGDLPFRVSIFWMLQNFGAGGDLCAAVQVAAAIAGAVAAWIVWRDARCQRADRMALTIFFSLLATPYGYTDDMVAWSVALGALAQQRGWRIGLLDALFWLWPALCPVIFLQTGLLLTPLVVVIAAARTWFRCGRSGLAARDAGAQGKPTVLLAART